jgi:hypothetical protein
MTKLLLLAGAAAMAAAAPAIAKPGEKGHASHANHAKAEKVHGKSDAKALHAKSTRKLVDRNRNRIDDRDEALARKYGGALCPPGLWKKTPSCVPPGQAKRMFREGQRLSSSYRYYTPYDNIPLALRDHYDLSDDYRYIYRDNVIYQVDPTTMLVREIINAVL